VDDCLDDFDGESLSDTDRYNVLPVIAALFGSITGKESQQTV